MTPAVLKFVTAKSMAGRGDQLPVSKMPSDGKFPTATRKRKAEH
jgi:hypothetical protein